MMIFHRKHIPQLIILTLSWWPLPAFAQVSPTLTLSPPKYDISVLPGQIQQASILVANQSEVPIPVTLELMDFSPKDNKGGIDFGKPLPGHSAVSWFRLPKKELLLKSKETQTVVVDISPPDNITPGSYFAVVMFQATLPSNYFEEGANAKIVPWIGELFLLRVGEPPMLSSQDLIIDSYSAPLVSFNDKAPVKLRVRNNTNWHLSPETDFELKNLRTGEKLNTHIEPTTIMPGTTRVIEATLDSKRAFNVYAGSAEVHLAGLRKSVRSGPLSMTIWLLLPVSLIFILLHRFSRPFRQRVNRAIKVFFMRS